MASILSCCTQSGVNSPGATSPASKPADRAVSKESKPPAQTALPLPNLAPDNSGDCCCSEEEPDAICSAVQLEQQRSHHITTELQLGRLSYAVSSPSIFESPGIFSRGSTPAISDSGRLSSINFQLSSPRVSDLASTEYLASASPVSYERRISLRHTPTVLPPAVQAVLEESGAVSIEDGNVEGLAEAASHYIAETQVSETFYIYDLGEVARLHATWLAAMPRVTPHYAVKCNPEPVMLSMLNALGAGFDCASISELEAAAALGVPQSRIIFANPCKRPADFRYAVANGVETTTFDRVSELQKIAKWNPNFKCVLRIRCDDETAKCNLGTKYGADMSEVQELLNMAKDLGLQVVGVSFHVGSGCQNVNIYGQAIQSARQVFDMAEAVGFPPLRLLDIGGGFTAPCDEGTSLLFKATADVINSSLERWFPAGCGVHIISEPGRFFAETSATRFSNIVGHRPARDDSGEPIQDYWISDSSHGSFRIQVAVDGLEPSYLVLRSPLLPPVTAAGVDAAAAAGSAAADSNHSPFGQFQTMLASRLLGISGNDGDKIHQAAQLPLLRVGDWLMFPYAGAYSVCSASNYSCGAFVRPPRLFVFSSEADKGWGDVLPREATSIDLDIPPTIPEHAAVVHEEETDIEAIAAAAAIGLEGCQSASLSGSFARSASRTQSLQRSLSRTPSKPRG